MWRVARLQVNGGFLSGLEVDFQPGLNVLIGARGAGKTTLLELIRHATGTSHPDKKQQKASQSLIEALLKDGEVIVDFIDGDSRKRVVVDASGSGRDESLAESIIALGQNELELAASDADSRRNLLDLHSAGSRVYDSDALEQIGTLTVRAFKLRLEADAAADRMVAYASLKADRDVVAAQRADLLDRSTAGEAAKLQLLQGLDAQVAKLASNQRALQLTADALSNVALAISTIEVDAGSVAEHLASVGLDVDDLTQEWQTWTATLRQLSTLRVQFDQRIERAQENSARAAVEARMNAAPLRAELEEARAGLGDVTSALNAYEAQLAELDRVKINAKKTHDELARILYERGNLFDALETEQERLFTERLHDARRITANLSNDVTVVVEHMSDVGAYSEVLSDVLRGSSIRQTTIDVITQTTLPRQLLEAVEADDISSLASITGLANDRIQRVLERLRDADILEVLARVTLLDTVDVRLVDGAVEKSVSELSTGQKCAVTLPIILAEQGKSLLLDQPEDHLDNEFLVGNVVRILRARSAQGLQTIVATHNANIPVLGEAQNVVTLVSNGKTGSIKDMGAFDDLRIVAKVTSLMEGGRDAFKQRAAFYKEHGSLD